MTDAPQDGQTYLFEIKYRVRAFWCDDQKRWVLSSPLKLEYLPARATHINHNQQVKHNGTVGT